MSEDIHLGDRVVDRISGLRGIAIGITEYLYGCKHVCVAPEELKDGKRIESDWLDEGRLTVVDRAAVERPATAAEREGGPSVGPLPPTP